MIFMLRGNLVLCKYLTFFRDIQLKLRHTNPKRELKACLCISLLSDSLSALIYIYKNIYVYIYILKRKKICTKQPLSGVNVPMHSIFQNPLVNFMKIYLPKNCELFYPDSHE